MRVIALRPYHHEILVVGADDERWERVVLAIEQLRGDATHNRAFGRLDRIWVLQPQSPHKRAVVELKQLDYAAR